MFQKPPTPHTARKSMTKGAHLISAIYKNVHIIPLESHPQAIYFLLNFEVFTRAWDLWLGYGLESLGYDVRTTHLSQL